MDKLILLDLFCGAGGAGYGYHLAGFRVVGVDYVLQKRYPFEFIQADLNDGIPWKQLAFIGICPQNVSVYHASPPCERHTRLNRIRSIKASTEQNYIDMIPFTREILKATSKLYIIENVPEAPLIDPIVICGAQLGLKVYRHRLFESNVFLLGMKHSPHKDKTPPSGRGPSPKGFITINSGGALNIPDGYTASEYKNDAMGINWMTQMELTKAVPPAYTKFIGDQLMRHLGY